MASPLSVFARKKRDGGKISMISLYDAPSAQIACDAGVDALLVGDSMGNVILGYDTTIPVTMEMIVHHTGAVVRGVKSSSRPDVPVVADLPFASYATEAEAVQNAAALLRAGAHAVKLETPPSALDALPSGRENVAKLLARNGIPVMAHIGFTPQAVLQFDTIVQGRDSHEAAAVVDSLWNLGDCFAVVLEAMTAELAQKITSTLSIPTIGIGAGAGCNGQVLVWSDLVGLSPTTFKFVKQYARTRELWAEAARSFVSEVASGQFPAQENTYYMREAEAEKFQSLLQGSPEESKSEEPALGAESNREDRGLLQEVERIWRGD